MENSKIEWTDHTFNPWIGCTKVSPGCLNCYAEARDQRFAGGIHWGPGAPRQRTSVQNWNEPRKWNRAIAEERAKRRYKHPGFAVEMPDRPRVFSASLADWLDHEIPIEWLADFLFLIYSTPELDWLLLTKRPRAWRVRLEEVLFTPTSRHSSEFWSWLRAWLNGAAPANVWIGTTAEDQDRYNERAKWIARIPARIHFLSCEPLLGPVNLGLMGGFVDWVIVGGESGPDARPMHALWAHSLRAQCESAGVAFFFKQWGEHNYNGEKVGKIAAGKELNGQILQAFPV